MSPQVIITAITVTAIFASIIVMANKLNKVRTSMVRCTDLVTGDVVVMKVNHTGIITPFNRGIIIDYAKNRMENDGIIPNRMTIM